MRFGSSLTLANMGLLLVTMWLVLAVPAWANINQGELHCFTTQASIKGANLLPFMSQQGNMGLDSAAVHKGRAEQTRALKTDGNDHWFQFCLHNTSDFSQQLVLKLAPATLSEIDFYPQREGLPVFKTGSSQSISTRDIPSSGFGFKVSLAPKEQQLFHLRINASGNPFYRRSNIAENPFFEATLWDRDSYDIENNQNENLFGIIVGVFLALVIYNLLLFFSARQKTSLLYIFLISSVFVVLLSLSGRLSQFAPASLPQFNNQVLVVFYPLSVLLAALFLREFIKLKNYPRLDLIGWVLLALCATALLLSRVSSAVNFAQVCDVVAVLISVYFGVFVPVYTFAKDRLVVAKYILITQALFLFSLVDRALFSFGITDQYYVPYKIVTAGMLGLILFSYFMGLIAYREKQAAQRAAMEQLNISNTLKSNYNKQLKEELEQKTADIRAMNHDLEQQANKLRQLDDSKSRFFANISHEFRTPLTLIEGPLAMLLEQKEFPEKQTLEGVLRNSTALKGLIDQILLLSELDENALDLNTAKTNVVQAVKEFAAQFDSVFKQKGVQLTCQADRPDIDAYVDLEKLQIILNNLLSNALKFTDASGSVSIQLSSTAEKTELTEDFSRDEYLQMLVTDTGQGIPSHELVHVFDRYFQSDSEPSKSGIGTGIGLALVKELVELHGGEVTVESCYKEESGDRPSGTAFCVTLPLGRAHLRDNEISTGAGHDFQAKLETGTTTGDSLLESSDQASVQNATILVVDDNQDMRQYICRLLQSEYSVVTAADGIEAEAVLAKQVPDLIITDLMMPNRNGLELVRSIKQQSGLAKIPIIMLTARAGLHDRIKGLMAAVDDYLIKPFNGRELLVRIQNLLDKQAQFKAFYHDSLVPSESSIRTQTQPPSETYIGKVKAIVEQRMMDSEFGVTELADALHVSEATLRRRLADQANFTPAAFIRHCRLEKARQLAAQGNMRSIGELARAVGFNQPSYFARLYQKTFNHEIVINKAAS